MTKNRRKHTRVSVTVNIKISHPSIEDKIVKTRNISDSGIFILVEPTEMPAEGEIIVGQVQGMADTPPSLSMKVVRVENEGLGMEFLNNIDEEG